MTESIYVEKLVQVDGRWQWQPSEVKVDTSVDFQIDELNLNTEICKMGVVLLKYADLTAELSAELKRKEEALKSTSANIAGALRSQAEKDGVKLTEAKLQEQIICHASYQTALSPLHVLRASAVKCENWWRVANTKADLLKALAFRQSAEIRKAGY